MKEEALEIIARLKLENERLRCESNQQSEKIDLLKEQIDALMRRLYGRKSERFENPDQLNFLEELGLDKPEKQASEKPKDLQAVSYTRRKPSKKKPGTKPLPDHLPRETISIDPPESERTCGCCGKQMVREDEVVTEELDIIPPQFRVKRFVQGKWRCPEHMNRHQLAPLPARPIQNGRASPRLLAYLIISKYLDHLPLNRQEQIFKRHGVHLPRSTMDQCLGSVCPLLQAIVMAMKRRLLKERFLQADETPIRAVDRNNPGKTVKCYLWSYGIPDGEVVYDVTRGRHGRNPRRFLEGFSGHVQSDGYVGFNELYSQDGIEHIACMAHIRRKFFESRAALPERVDQILTIIRALYDIEEEAKERSLPLAARQDLRRERATPLLDTLKERIEDLAPIPTPSSGLGKAVRYARDEWEALLRYVEVAESEIDNNSCERSLRPAVVGRNNWLFLGRVKAGGERASTFYSLTQTCKRLGINAFDYLVDVLERIASHPQSRIDELTPRGWQDARASENSLA